jgi:hypothetical protein
MTQLIFKRAPIGWNQDDYDVVEGGVIATRAKQSAKRNINSARL